jgi:iron complex outermembrane receptor protein
MKKILILSLVIVTIGQLRAQSLLNGIVIDGRSLEPLEGASVWLDESKTGTKTNEKGYFNLQLPAPGQGNVQFSFVGYKPFLLRAVPQKDLIIKLYPESGLSEVIISAVRANESDPVTQNTVEKPEIDKKFIGEDAAFLLEKLAPSIISYSESGTSVGNYGQMRLRGMDQTRINITLNGAPLNDMIDQGVFFSNFIDFGNSIESVQVQRGVGTSTNGTSSYAGSVGFESVNLNDSVPYAEVQLMGGSFKTRRASAEIYSGRLHKGFSLYSRYTSFQSDGFKYHTSTNSYSFFISGAWEKKNNRLMITGFTGRSRNGLGYLPVSINDIKSDPRTNYVNENDIDDFGQSFLQLQQTHSFRNSSLVSSVYYGSAGGDFPAGYYQTDSLFNPGNPGNYQLSNRLVQVNYPLFNHHYGFMSNYSFTGLSGKLDLSAGIHLYTFHRQNLMSTLPDDAHPFYDERSVKNEFSTYVKAGYHINKLTIYGDIQFRLVSLTIIPDTTLLPDEPDIIKNWTFVNPKVGLTYSINPAANLYVFAGRSYREPTKVDILGGFELNPSNYFAAASDQVKPERVDDIELGFRFNRKGILANINFFYMNFHNEIAPIGELVPEGFLQLRKNIEWSYRRGIEFDYRIPMFRFLDFTGNLTWMHSRISEYAPSGDSVIYKNVQQALSPDIMGFAEVDFHHKKLFNLVLTGKFAGSSFLEPTNNPGLTMPGYFILTFRAGIQLINNISIDLVADNLLNKIYYTNGTPVDVNMDGKQEPGYFVQSTRSFYVQLKLRL